MERNRAVTVTQPASGWRLQRQWGPSFGSLYGLNVLSALPVGESGAADVVLGKNSALEGYGGGSRRTAAPGAPARGRSGRGQGRERGTGAASAPVELQLPAGTAHARPRDGSGRGQGRVPRPPYAGHHFVTDFHPPPDGAFFFFLKEKR